MKREKVEHILRAAGRITGKRQFVLIGSAAIVAWREVVPPELAMSRDIDLFAYDAPDVDEISDQLDGALGQASQFDQTFGYYCDGVGPETAIMPSDWRDRAIEFSNSNTEGVAAVVPEPNDIALSKLCAWRPKDVAWLRAAMANLIVDSDVMRARLERMPSGGPDLGDLSARIDVLCRPPTA
ncbi:MAG: DUF6036 family nucleotidyltransferase [Vitreimonas sp.]